MAPRRASISSHRTPARLMPVSIARCQGPPPSARHRAMDSALESDGVSAAARTSASSSAPTGVKTNDRTRDARSAKLVALADGRDAVAPWLERLERARHGDGAEPVRVGLDHREERHARTFRERDRISAQRAQIDFDPGALLD